MDLGRLSFGRKNVDLVFVGEERKNWKRKIVKLPWEDKGEGERKWNLMGGAICQFLSGPFVVQIMELLGSLLIVDFGDILA